MRAFDVTAAASALGVSPKWLDNLLSHHHITGVVGGRQGVRRRIAPHAILRIAVTLELVRELGSPLHRALGIADEIVEHGRVTGPNGLELHLDVTSIANEIDARLAEATEAAAPRRRGRPQGASAKPLTIPQMAAAL